MAVKIKKTAAPSPFGEITVYTLTNESGAEVKLSSLGAGILSVSVPDKDGVIANIALAYANPADYMADGPCLGKIPGRYANRIGGGRFCIGNKEYRLNINNGPNALHGGPTGFQNRLWDSAVEGDSVVFSYRSEDDEENYPGNLSVTATYTWSDDNVLTLRLHAVTDAPTIVNLTSHAYWNLDGADAGSILDHRMRINAERYIPTDDTLVPTGEKRPVQDTPMDFREFKALGKDINADFDALRYGKGYDAGWLVDDWQPGKVAEAAVELKSERSGRRLIIDSDQPAAHVYTGNWLAGSPENASGRSYGDYEGVAVEMQGVPDAPNKPMFPSQQLNPGESYDRLIRFRFTTD